MCNSQVIFIVSLNARQQGGLNLPDQMYLKVQNYATLLVKANSGVDVDRLR